MHKCRCTVLCILIYIIIIHMIQGIMGVYMRIVIQYVACAKVLSVICI